jgi:CubicO group peptidase (beta-lactamase class C family)
MMTARLDETSALLERQIEEGLFTLGAQMAVDVEGQRVLDIALGENGTGRAMTADQVFRVYCTIKPVTSIAVARLVEDGSLDLDEPLVARLPDLRVLDGGVTLRHVLTHTAGLERPMAVEMELLPVAKRRATVARTIRQAGWRVGRSAAYSEYAGWQVLGWLLEAVTGTALRPYLRRTVLDPLELRSTWVGMTEEEYVDALPRIGLNIDARNLGRYPMVYERSQRVCMETNPAHGGYTNARDLATFYSRLLAGLSGETIAGLPSAAALHTFTSPARPVVFDEVLDRECSFGLGFMTGLSDHAFGDRCSSRSFGHSGIIGASFAFADPERALSVGVVYNGLVGYETAFLRRRALINTLYGDIGGVTVRESQSGQSAPRPRRRLFRRTT